MRFDSPGAMRRSRYDVRLTATFDAESLAALVRCRDPRDVPSLLHASCLAKIRRSTFEERYATQPGAPLSPEPQPAKKIIDFGGEPGRAAVLNYGVAMPGRYRGRRLMHLDLGLEDADVLPLAAELSEAIKALRWKKEGDVYSYSPADARELWFARARSVYAVMPTTDWLVVEVLAATRARADAKELDGRLVPVDVGELLTDLDVMGRPALGDGARPIRPPQLGPVILTQERQLVPFVRAVVAAYTAFVRGLPEGKLVLPLRRWDGMVITDTADAETVLSTTAADTHFFLVERYGISSFLGDYGLGRTVRTFTLLPGEETRISMKTWRTDTTKITEASSIVDSYDAKSASRFNDTVQKETTDKSTRNRKLAWHAEAEAKAQWGWGSAKVSGGASGENQSSREEFSKDVTNSVQEHSHEAASNRSNTVSLATEKDVVTGEELATERTIRNINLRRVLNFVFRELNQQYTTIVHLIDVKIGFATSTPDTYREVAIAGLRPLLESVLLEGKVDEVAQALLGLAGTVMDQSGTAVRTLDKLVLNSDGSFKVEDAGPDQGSGQWAPPPADRSFLYRWKPSALGQEGSANPVDGVVTSSTEIVMPTADLVVEALLGQADALDEFAMRAQFEDSEAKSLENRRLRLALDTLEALDDPAKRAEAWAKFFPPPAAPVTT